MPYHMDSLTKLSNRKKLSSSYEDGPVLYNEFAVKLATYNRSIIINEPISKDTSNAVSALLLYYDHQNHDPITMYINTDGGDVDSLITMYSFMKMIKSPVKTVCLSRAYSAGAVLLCAGTKGMRYVLDNSKVMIHNIVFAIGLPEISVYTDSDQYHKHLEKCNNVLMKIISNQTGKNIEKVKQDCSKDFYMTAKEAIAYGMADDIWRGQ